MYPFNVGLCWSSFTPPLTLPGETLQTLLFTQVLTTSQPPVPGRISLLNSRSTNRSRFPASIAMWGGFSLLEFCPAPNPPRLFKGRHPHPSNDMSQKPECPGRFLHLLHPVDAFSHQTPFTQHPTSPEIHRFSMPLLAAICPYRLQTLSSPPSPPTNPTSDILNA